MGSLTAIPAAAAAAASVEEMIGAAPIGLAELMPGCFLLQRYLSMCMTWILRLVM